MTRIGLFGGLFNPPHTGHLILAERAREALRLDIVYWIPSGNPPHKRIAAAHPSPEERLNMVRASIQNHGAFRALDFEVARKETSYSIDTVREVESRHPGAELFFLTGEDAWRTSSTWKESAELSKKVKFAVYPRPASFGAENKNLPPAIKIDAPAIDISSSSIRDQLRDCRSVRYLLHDHALKLIEENAWYASQIPETLADHIRDTEKFACAIAGRWNASLDVLDVVRIAARYHDAYKTMSYDDACAILRRRGETISELEARSPVLLHGRVAAARLETTSFALTGKELMEAVDAVRHHTTGRSGMSLAGEILMVADRIGKNWRSVDDVPVDLHDAMRDVFRQKLDEIHRRGEQAEDKMLEAARFYGATE